MIFIISDLSEKYILLLKILIRLNFKIYYIRYEGNSRELTAQNLKKNNILPLPIETIKKINSEYRPEFELDRDQVRLGYSKKLLSKKAISQFSNLFKNIVNLEKKIEIILHTKFSGTYSFDSCVVNIFSGSRKNEKIIYIETRLTGLLKKKLNNNVTKIFIPIDAIYFFVSSPYKLLKKLILLFFCGEKERSRNECSLNYCDDKVAYVVHKGGTGSDLLFQGSPYYFSDEKSLFNKYNILHFDYSNFNPSELNIKWVNLNGGYAVVKFILLTIFYSIKFRSINIIGIMTLIDTYLKYSRYLMQLKKYRKLTHVIIDYEILCPKSLLLAFEALGIKTIAAQERPYLTFNTVHGSFLNYYMTASNKISDMLSKSPSYLIEEYLPVGMYRSDYIYKYRNIDISLSFSKIIDKNARIITFFGFHSADNFEESTVDPMINWTAHRDFLRDAIEVATRVDNVFVILRYKNTSWMNNQFFINEIREIKIKPNIEISNEYSIPYFSYGLCAKSDLIVAKHSSIVDECLALHKKVILHDYTHNSKGYFLNTYNYENSNLFALSFSELLDLIVKNLDDSVEKNRSNYSDIYENYSDGNVIPRMHNILDELIH